MILSWLAVLVPALRGLCGMRGGQLLFGGAAALVALLLGGVGLVNALIQPDDLCKRHLIEQMDLPTTVEELTSVDPGSDQTREAR